MGTDLAAALDRYQEGKVEVRFVDELLEAWAWFSRDNGLPKLDCDSWLGRMQKPEAEECAERARARALNLNPVQFDRIDRVVSQLPAALRKVVRVEYLVRGLTQEARAGRLRLGKTAYASRRLAAQWVVWHALWPDIERWHLSMKGRSLSQDA